MKNEKRKFFGCKTKMSLSDKDIVYRTLTTQIVKTTKNKKSGFRNENANQSEENKFAKNDSLPQHILSLNIVKSLTNSKYSQCKKRSCSSVIKTSINNSLHKIETTTSDQKNVEKIEQELVLELEDKEDETEIISFTQPNHCRKGSIKKILIDKNKKEPILLKVNDKSDKKHSKKILLKQMSIRSSYRDKIKEKMIKLINNRNPNCKDHDICKKRKNDLLEQFHKFNFIDSNCSNFSLISRDNEEGRYLDLSFQTIIEQPKTLNSNISKTEFKLNVRNMLLESILKKEEKFKSILENKNKILNKFLKKNFSSANSSLQSSDNTLIFFTEELCRPLTSLFNLHTLTKPQTDIKETKTNDDIRNITNENSRNKNLNRTDKSILFITTQSNRMTGYLNSAKKIKNPKNKKIKFLNKEIKSQNSQIDNHFPIPSIESSYS